MFCGGSLRRLFFKEMKENQVKWGERLSLIGGIAIAGLVLVAFATVEGVQEAALAVLDWVGGLGGWGILLYFVLYVLIVIFLIPGLIFTLGAGFLFGFWIGGGIIVASVATGSGLAFLMARYALGEQLSVRIRQHPRIRLLDRGLQREGWKIVLLSRFLPLFPFKLSNYFFGLTGISFRDFVTANTLGIIPISLTNVYLGSLAAELADLTKREPQPWEWMLYVAGAFAAVGLLYYITRLARRSMEENLESEE